MEYIREVVIPFHAAEFRVKIVIDEASYEGLLHVSRSGNGALHPIEIVYLPDSVKLPLKPHQQGNCSWDMRFGAAAYIKRITFVEYSESEIPDERAENFLNAVNELTNGRIGIE